MVEFRIPQPTERDDLGAFVARAVRLEPDCVIRIRERDRGQLDTWVTTPFDALATRTVRGSSDTPDVAVSGNELLAALAVVGRERIDPGPPQDLRWRTPLPPSAGWLFLDELPARLLAELADKGVALARENAGPKGTPPASLLDQTVLTVHGAGLSVTVPMRCLFVLTGLGFLGPLEQGDAQAPVRVFATDSWLRIDAHFGAVVRQRRSLLPLLI